MKAEPSRDTEEKTASKKSIGREILEYVLTLGIVVVAVFLLNTFVLINARIPSESMQNTIMKGDQIFGFRLAYLNKMPERYDIVIFRYPDNRSEYFIKRVIGLPGETVHIRDGKVYIDDSDTPLDDTFIAEEQWPERSGEELVFEVPEGHYFMLGDNRNHSRDSRYWTNPYVPLEDILGKAVFRYWPVTKMTVFSYDSEESA